MTTELVSLDDLLEQVSDHIDWRRDNGLLGDSTEALLQELGRTLATLVLYTDGLAEQLIVARLGDLELEERPEDIGEIDIEDCVGAGPH